MKTLYITTKITVEDNVDPDDFASEVDYEFRYPGVLDTEIVDVIETVAWATK